jgi:hypothetical protein
MKKQEEIKEDFQKFHQAKISHARLRFIKKSEEGLTKINSMGEDFRKKEKEIRADLEEARRLWRGLSERFRWWQKQEIP